MAAITKTLWGNLSKQDNNSETTLFSISLLALSLEPAIESISSIKINEGALEQASKNKFLKFFSLSPDTPPINSVDYL